MTYLVPINAVRVQIRYINTVHGFFISLCNDGNIFFYNKEVHVTPNGRRQTNVCLTIYHFIRDVNVHWLITVHLYKRASTRLCIFTWRLPNVHFKTVPCVDDLETVLLLICRSQRLGTEVAVIDDVIGTDVDWWLRVTCSVWKMYRPCVWTWNWCRRHLKSRCLYKL